MTSKLKILNIFCEVTVKAETLETDSRWQPFAVEFWQRMFDSSPNELHRQCYSRNLIQEKTRQGAMNKMKVWSYPNAGTQRPGTPDGSLTTETRKPGSLK